MTNINKFAKNEMTESQEQKYVESLYDGHYDQKLKAKYSAKLAAENGLERKGTKSNNKSKKSTKIRTLLIGVTSIAALFVLGFFLLPMMNGEDQLSTQQMASNMITIEKIDVKRGGQEDSELRLEIISEFNSGDFQEAIKLYKSLETLTDIDNYRLGLAYFYSKDYPNTKSTFANIEMTSSFKYSAELTWYKALTHIHLNEYEKAKPLLEQVAITSWKKEEALNLLSSISK